MIFTTANVSSWQIMVSRFYNQSYCIFTQVSNEKVKTITPGELWFSLLGSLTNLECVIILCLSSHLSLYEQLDDKLGEWDKVTVINSCSSVFTCTFKTGWDEVMTSAAWSWAESWEENSAVEGKFKTGSWKIWRWRYFPFPASSYDLHTGLWLLSIFASWI